MSKKPYRREMKELQRLQQEVWKEKNSKRGVCIGSNRKTRFPDNISALMAIANIDKDPNNKNETSRKYDGRQPIRAYHCQICDGWHITKMKALRDDK